MNPNADRQGLYFIPCRLRISMVKRFALSITHMLGFFLKRAKKFSTISLSSFTIIDLVLC